MRTVLWAAAIYNLIWGGWVVLRPADCFVMSGIAPPTYPGIWQCVGMIVGVYGIGYAIAAGDPMRHWPIVLVGWLGKTFGPIGMLFNVMQPADTPGRLPTSWLWLNVTNDLIWWLPFAAILWHAARHHAGTDDGDDPTIESANRSVRDQHGRTLHDLSAGGRVLVVMLRHSGCTFCREALSDLSKLRTSVPGLRLALVHLGTENASTAAYFDGYDLGDVPRFADPNAVLYRAYGLPRGGVRALFGPAVWWRGFKAFVRGHGVGKMDGDGFRLGGTFLIADGRILHAHRNSNAADQADYQSIIKTPNTEVIDEPNPTPQQK